MPGVAATEAEEESNKAGWWLLLVAGVGIFCGCVGKSAQFPLHVWLPDAMEGPTPVSALVHSATMVAAGVYLVGRFYPAFSPEALLVIAYIGCITLFIAATIAITATDIKRVLAYSTVSQLGYMMLSLGLGGWVAGMFHLITHAFFKSLLFLCSGSVIHAVHSNEMTDMGGLRKKMPITAYTMLIGCLAIIGAGIPLSTIGFSGYYSKDAIIEQAFSYGHSNPKHVILQWAPVVGAFITAFYMFRLWFMTFAGEPQDKHRYDHAHESPRVMTGPLILLAVFAVGVGWTLPGSSLNVTNLLEQARPVGTLATTEGVLWDVQVPNEHISHEPEFKVPAGIAAFSTASLGVLLARDYLSVPLPESCRVEAELQATTQLAVEQMVVRRALSVDLRRSYYADIQASGLVRPWGDRLDSARCGSDYEGRLPSGRRIVRSHICRWHSERLRPGYVGLRRVSSEVADR